ncbi:MAG: hypothetical protein AAGF07_02750 [Patescibacteria group bacterium]
MGRVKFCYTKYSKQGLQKYLQFVLEAKNSTGNERKKLLAKATHYGCFDPTTFLEEALSELKEVEDLSKEPNHNLVSAYTELGASSYTAVKLAEFHELHKDALTKLNTRNTVWRRVLTFLKC